MRSDPWHYPRPDLAGRTFMVLEQRLASALTLFAPRRTGKTQFLLHDLGPLAERRGHRVVYVSFMQARLTPLASLLHAVETARSGGSLWDRVSSSAARLAPKLKLSSPIPMTGSQATAELDLGALGGKPPGELLLYLDDVLGKIANRRKPTLLLLDEIQELALEPDNASLVAALRTSLDKRKDTLIAVFTGSSQEGLRRMFGAREAPFFHFATSLDLPALDAGFVDHLLAAFERASGRALPRKAALDAFDSLHCNPFFFRRLLEPMLLDPSLTMPEALGVLHPRIASELRFPDTWLSLSAIQRATALALADGAEKPFSETTRAAIGRQLGEPTPTIARVQAAIRKLSALGVADNASGSWAVSDPEFARWIREIRGD